MSPVAASTDISCDGVCVRVESPFASSFFDYASVVYTPYFVVHDTAVAPSADIDVKVRLHLVAEAEVAARADQVLREPGARAVPIEKIRTGTTALGDDGTRRTVDGPRSFVYHSDPARRKVDVWGAEPERLLLEGIRLSRTLLVGVLVEEHGYVPLHASCVALDGEAIIFTGNSGAGKTTSAIAAMRHLGAELVTNDLLLLKRPAGPNQRTRPLTALGIPLQVRMATGTIRSMGLLPHLDPYDEVFPFLEDPDWRERDRKIEVSAKRVAAWFKGSPRAEAPVACFVWPRISGGDQVSIRPISPAETADRLRSEVTYFDPAWPTWTGIGYRAPSLLPPAGEQLIDECGKYEAIELHASRQVHDAIREMGRVWFSRRGRGRAPNSTRSR